MRVRRLLAVVALLALAALWLWDVGALAFSPYATGAWRTASAVAFALGIPLLAWALHRHARWPVRAVYASLLALCGVPLLGWLVLLQPSNQRSWSVDQDRLPHAQLAGGQLRLQNVRNFTWRSTTDFDPAWETRRYDLDRLARAWFVVEPFTGFPGAAHAFLSFEFDDGEFLAVSVEIRKEVGESFSVLRGLYRNYELMYVFGDERDLVWLRSGPRGDVVYLYPLRGGAPVARAMLLDVLQRANALHQAPEFYHSLANTCMTNVARHANRVRPGLVPFSWHLLLPGHADERALALGLIDFDGTMEQARARFRINERAQRAVGAADFSRRIRAGR
jgi:hypothetical protein